MGGVGSAKEYATLDCYVHSKNVELKIFASNYNLPVLDRKWERVDISVRADRYINSNKMRKMILDGKRGVEICQELGVSPSAVSNARARMNVDFRGDQK